jgi:hypothetical protein
MWRKAVISAVCLVLAVGVPVLELNATHLFNPQWPSHARLHEAWQLLGNGGLALISLYLALAAGRDRLAGAIMLSLTGAFLVAYAVSGLYGGSMLHTDGTELAVGGVNAAVLVMLAASAALIAVVWPKRTAAV